MNNFLEKNIVGTPHSTIKKEVLTNPRYTVNETEFNKKNAIRELGSLNGHESSRLGYIYCFFLCSVEVINTSYTF